MAADQCLRRLVSALSHGPPPPAPPPSLLLRVALSSSAPSTLPPPPPEPARKGEEEEATEGKVADVDAGKDEEEDDVAGGVHVNTTTGEIGGPLGPEPTRYGDWERGGRCSDF